MNFDNYANSKINVGEGSNSGNTSNPSSLSKCLDQLKVEWNKNQSIASLWQDWPKIAGPKIASNCIPLTFHGGILTIGANHPQWIQALMFNRIQLLAALKAEGHEIKDIRIKQHYPQKSIQKETENAIWEEHPSRSDIHGKNCCPICNVPAPSGEISLWGKCLLCRRQDLTPKRRV
ncbi:MULTISPECIES: DUF721 domain-containing protein [Prochlorococcus]|uniref:Uncharacterized Zn ribbon-containing conserved protein n=1 Tax=Prochlorococcus marinus (strain SARG / CCMP1375 / SS120) TaxID=167539 RepID=Q7VDE9_PROMA|nr:MULTISPECIES: DUF721 domain-containing protein [Prochlorococcus]AAP99474.1 Uncharacterized Zn ribbon-containing conserved protein [Prochlorococcus marinus subsp. marinus str. CCMP1375]KGG11257.1 hypothetical protein EV04_1333 [Prochlorococcus marinus str. LG]KGG21596.1 hypothetical protein EV08_0685 [Prochlorococcus marinus str. SS2]KGG23062.1 hypothetical protein EV09_1807 [Prochlorococcus marinus str. SS35]KGG33769.1 hypothetical protein EV10_0206 [Prochlorococcus marinus str. SS51]